MSERLNWERDGRDWPNRQASRFVAAGGLRFHVQVMGSSAAAPVLLMLHGTGASTHSWRGLAPLLAQQFTLVMPDLPGHGFTSMPPSGRLSLPGMALALDDLLVQLKLQPAFALGHSAGAALLMHMCLAGQIQPQALVSLNGALLPYGGALAEFLSPVARLLTANLLVPQFFAWQARQPARLDRLLANTGSQIDASGKALYARLVRDPGHVGAALAMMAGWDLAGLKRALPGLAVPVLLVAGGRDHMIPADQAFAVKKLLPCARVTYLRHHGHLAHEQNPREIADIVLEFARETQLSRERFVA